MVYFHSQSNNVIYLNALNALIQQISFGVFTLPIKLRNYLGALNALTQQISFDVFIPY